MRKTFTHNPVDLGYDDLIAETTETGRVYYCPDGSSFNSVTTVLKVLSEDAIQAWRKRVGPDVANQIGVRAANRGTAVHSIIERYLNNEEDYAKDVMPDVLQSFTDLQPILDERLTEIRALEAPLYSTHLKLAGRVDCVGVFDGKLSIVDFKTSRKLKRRDWITNYFAQEAAYAIMWEERTRMPITQLVTLITVDNEQPQVFIEHRDNWTDLLFKAKSIYESRL
tara:strand:+ start:318 stop:989 length:672 start_codon:yes stop_codon:yes gene_type:complete